MDKLVCLISIVYKLHEETIKIVETFKSQSKQLIRVIPSIKRRKKKKNVLVIRN